MQLKKIIQTIVLILTITAQQINAKPRRVSIDKIQQLIKPEMQKIKNSQLRTFLSQDSVDDVFSWVSEKSQHHVQFRVQGSPMEESRRKFKEFVKYLK